MEAIKQAEAMDSGLKDMQAPPELVTMIAAAIFRSPGCPTKTVHLELPKGLGALGQGPMVAQVIDLEGVYRCSVAFIRRCQNEYMFGKEGN